MDKRGADYVHTKMPLFGFGTWQVRFASSNLPQLKPDQIFALVDAALAAGYRYIDTAQLYENEAAIGTALATLLPKYGLKREDIFITSKLGPPNQGAARARHSVEESLKKLKVCAKSGKNSQTDYLDLFLIHWPGASYGGDKTSVSSKARNESWTALEDLYKKGKLRAIGVSNYNVEHLEQLLKHAKVSSFLFSFLCRSCPQ